MAPMDDALDTRTALLRAGLECFAERGFDCASTRQIADRAGRPLSLLSHHFGSKEGLYLEVFRDLLQTLARNPALHPPEAEHLPATRDEAFRVLRAQVHALYLKGSPEVLRQEPLLELGARLWLQELRSPRPCLIPLLQEFTRPRSAAITRCIQVLRPDLDEPSAVFLGCSILGQVVGHGLLHGLNQAIWGNTHAPVDPARAADILLDLSLNGLLGFGHAPTAAPPAP